MIKQVFDVIRFFGFRAHQSAANLLYLIAAPWRQTQLRRESTDFKFFVL